MRRANSNSRVEIGMLHFNVKRTGSHIVTESLIFIQLIQSVTQSGGLYWLIDGCVSVRVYLIPLGMGII